MNLNRMKNKALGVIATAAMLLSVSACMMEPVEEIEGPTQVEAKPTMGPTSIVARISDVAKDGKEIFDVTEVQPVPPGGMQGWNKYLSENLKYPAEAKSMGIEGTVIVVFLINSDGTISNVEILKGIGGGADEEAQRVVQNSPNWTPAMQRDQVVNSRMRLPVRFSLGNSEFTAVEIPDNNPSEVSEVNVVTKN